MWSIVKTLTTVFLVFSLTAVVLAVTAENRGNAATRV